VTGDTARRLAVHPARHGGRACTAPPHPPPQWPPGAGRAHLRDDVCGRCNALLTCCHRSADVDALRLFVGRTAIHEWTGAHACHVRRRLDAADRGAP
jgi:hypothetical protein